MYFFDAFIIFHPALTNNSGSVRIKSISDLKGEKRMNTENLKEFIVLAETRNFWEASDRLYMNQSTLSKHIKSLENELGVPLFTRTTRRVELTSYGQIFLPYAQSITRTEFEGVTAIQRILNIENGLLTIGALPSMPQYHITQFLAQFQTLYPEATVRITEDDPVHLMEYLETDKCELIFTREYKSSFEKNFLDDPHIVRIPYMRDKLVSLVPEHHPLASAESLTLQQLKNERFCFIKEGSLMYQICMDACHNANFVPNIVFTSHRIDSILDMVTNQNCVALLMDAHLSLPKNGPKQTSAPWNIIPITPVISSQLSLCYRSDNPLSRTAQLFVDLCNDKLFKKTHKETCTFV